MVDSFSLLPAGLPANPTLLPTLLDLLPMGVMYYTPVVDAAGTLTDLALAYLNPAAQRMTRLPAQPGTTYRQQFPTTDENGAWDFHRRSWLGPEPQHFQFYYAADGFDAYFRVAAQRLGEGLLTIFTDTQDEVRSLAEQALLASQARERAALVEAETERRRFQEVLMQLPAQVAVNRGPDHVFALVNEPYQRMFPARPVLGLPVRQALPELAGQQFFDMLDRVYQTGEPFFSRAMPAEVDFTNTGNMERRYVDVFFQALYDAQGRVDGVLNFSYDVTAQVEARQQVEQLNQELETRVQERTRQLSEQQELLGRILGQVPAAVATFSGPEHRYSFFNAQYQQLLHNRAAYGVTVAEAIPEAAEQGFVALLDQVYQTGQPFVANEQLVELRQPDGTAADQYFNFVYQPLRDSENRVNGILSFTVEVTGQVLARRQNDALQAELLAATEQRAAEREGLYHVLEQAPVGVTLLRGSELRFDYVNPTFQRIFPDRPLLGLNVDTAFPEAEAQGFRVLHDQVYQTGEPYFGNEVPFTEVPAEGQPPRTVYFNFSYQAVREAGEIVGLCAFAFDVTASVLARQQNDALQAELLAATEQRVAEREALYQVFEQTPAAVSLLRGPGYRFDYVNPVFQQVFAGRQLVGRDFAEVLPDAARQGYLAMLDGVYHTGETFFGAEVPFVSEQPGAPPRTTYFNFTYQAYREHGQIVGISTFALDVTEQVLARQARQRELQNLFAQVPMALVVLRGPQFIIEQANAQAEVIWGVAVADVLGRPHFEVIPGSAGQGFEEMLTGILATGETIVLHEVLIKLARAHTGQPSEGYYNVVFKPLFEEGQPQATGIVVMWTEATDQVLARRQVQALNEELTTTNADLNKSNTQLTRTNVDLDNFIYTASHDLKAPITNIEGLLLALEYELPAEGRTGDVPLMLTMMQEAVERFQRTITHLTDLSRLQKEHSPDADAVALAPVVEAVRLDLTPLLAQTRGRLTVSIPAGLTVMFAEKNLRSVVYNLLSNAFKYHHPDRQPEVQLRSWPADDYLVLEVEDNGLGLDLAQGQEKLFAMFQRLHTHVEGTGVGLYMVKRILENAGGRIEVSSQLGEGSTFRVYFQR